MSRHYWHFLLIALATAQKRGLISIYAFWWNTEKHMLGFMLCIYSTAYPRYKLITDSDDGLRAWQPLHSP